MSNPPCHIVCMIMIELYETGGLEGSQTECGGGRLVKSRAGGIGLRKMGCAGMKIPARNDRWKVDGGRQLKNDISTGRKG